MLELCWLIITYLMASFPFGLLVAQAFCGIDPRTAGSRNTGSTNVARLCGFGYGVVTLVLDVLKGFLPVILGTAFSHSAFFLSLVVLTAILGHMHSIFLYGKGGKGVATTIGAFLALSPLGTLFALIICVVLIATSGFVSLGSLGLAASLPVFMLLTGNFGFIPVALLVAVLIFVKHSENIARLKKGEEKPWVRKPRA